MSTDGAGVRGEAWGSGLTYGVSGYSSSSTGAGIYGSGGGSGSDTTYGGWFVDSSEYGAGVVGKSRQGFFEGYGHGGYFETSSRWGAGVSGHADSADAAGVFGYCTVMVMVFRGTAQAEMVYMDIVQMGPVVASFP